MADAEHKIMFAGPVGAGKTTAIGAISDIPVVATEARASDAVAMRKSRTTVAMDYGLIMLDGGRKLHLYGTPGQERFRFMWDILATGSLGVILLMDNARPDPFADLGFYLDAFNNAITGTAVAVGVTRTDIQPKPSITAYQMWASAHGFRMPILTADARSREDIATLLKVLLAMLDPSLRR